MSGPRVKILKKILHRCFGMISQSVYHWHSFSTKWHIGWFLRSVRNYSLKPTHRWRHDTQNNDTQVSALHLSNRDTQLYDTILSVIMLNVVMLSVIQAQCVSNKSNLVNAVILSVVMLNVVVPNKYVTYGACIFSGLPLELKGPSVGPDREV